jgi:hypothetical protein
MSGTRGGLGRIIAMGIALALALLLLAAKEATAGKYSVAQCGWYVGADANWADSTGGAKFRPDGWCVPPAGQDPFDGAHLKSFTRDGQGTVSGTRYARWRWEAPEGTGITRVSGTWWHALHDGIEQRIGVDNWSGGFDVFAAASTTDVTPRDFVVGFPTPMPALEDRLLCARAESRWCSLEPGSWSAIRALTITIEDDFLPVFSIGGDMLAGGWLRGEHKLEYSALDGGSGLKRTEALIDGHPVLAHDHPCNVVSVSGELRATTMRPCPTTRVGYYPISTTGFSDGPHIVSHCATDFAGNVNCGLARTILIDNNPPAHPRDLTIAGGNEGWHRGNDFDLTWVNPDQGPASPIGGANWRITGPAGYDSGAKFVPGHQLATLQNLFVPRAGTYSLSIWLRDEAGNESASSAASLPLRFDDVPPGVVFEPAAAGDAAATQIQAEINDAHSGPASGEIYYRRLDGQQWTELPAKFQRGASEKAVLLARLPSDLGPGTYVFRADAADAAGNTASSTRRRDGTEMTVRKVAGEPIAGLKRAEPVRGKARIFARLRWRGRSGTELTVPFRTAARLSGRLVDDEGAGLAGRALRVTARPSRGALGEARVETLQTGPHGGFQLQLPAGTSRRITVTFPGDAHLGPAERSPLTLRVRSGVELTASSSQLRTGEAVRFSGRVRSLGAPLPRRGKLVSIQYFEQASRRWRPVLVTRTDHDGHFHARYRFRYISGAARIRFRAAVLAEERWPYAPGASRPLVLRVTG